MTALRRAFETWFTSHYRGCDLTVDANGNYVNDSSRLMWAAFKAGRAYVGPTS